jgi:hypothetical protein
MGIQLQKRPLAERLQLFGITEDELLADGWVRLADLADSEREFYWMNVTESLPGAPPIGRYLMVPVGEGNEQ